MRHSEVRKGNYVYDYYKKVVKVHDVFMDSTISGYFPCLSDGRICFDLCTVSGIEITEEWLSKLGFTEKEMWPSGYGQKYKNKDCKEVVIEYCKCDRFYMIGPAKSDRDGVYKIEYVHELQNLFKDMTGQMLTIKED